MLKLQSLTKVFPGPFVALSDVSLEISSGMFGLLGPNGAGKSTLMKILTGLLAPTSGGVSLDGTDTVANQRFIHECLGYLPQDFGFYPHLTGRQMLEFLLKLKGISGKTTRLGELATALLTEVNLISAADRKVGTYSGGMRQRLGLAQAIAGNPRVVIVDEPTAGLDPQERQRMYRLLSELGKNRLVLLSTHLVEDVAVLCPRFAVLKSGRLIRVTSPSEARESLNGILFEGSVDEADLPALYQQHQVTQAFLVEGRMRVRLCLPKGSPPPTFDRVPPTLEDAFVLMMSDQTDIQRPSLAAVGS